MMGKFGEFVLSAFDVYLRRNVVYGDAWKKMDLRELASFLRGKAARVAVCLETGGDKDKVLDDLRDIVIYSAMIASKLGDGGEL